MQSSSPFQLVFFLFQPNPTKNPKRVVSSFTRSPLLPSSSHPEKEDEEEKNVFKLTLSLTCSNPTTPARTTVAMNTENVTQGTYSPGWRYSSQDHFEFSARAGGAGEGEGGEMTTWELGMIPSMEVKWEGEWRVVPTKRFWASANVGRR